MLIEQVSLQVLVLQVCSGPTISRVSRLRLFSHRFEQKLAAKAFACAQLIL